MDSWPSIDTSPNLRAVIVVEGVSDRVAVEAVAARQGRHLADEGVAVVPIGGAHALRSFLVGLGSRRNELRLAGLCDAGEELVFRTALERSGFGAGLTQADMERLGFYVCEIDLEDELIRALGPATVETILAAHDDLGAFRTFLKEPAWRGQRIEAQLRRFMGSADRRKIRYARLLSEALDTRQVPRPLSGVLASV